MPATPTVVHNTRVEDSDSGVGWSSIGGGQGGAAEAAFKYQGNALFNRKIVSSAGSGFFYEPTLDGGTVHDMTSVAKKVWMVKAAVTDYGGLQPTNGLRVRIGSSSADYYDYVLAGTLAKIPSLTEYPPKGGLLIIPIDPNVAGYRESTSGTPDLTAVNYFGEVAAFLVSSAKSENVGLDAIDLGTGITQTGGLAFPTFYATFFRFLEVDESVTGLDSNRFGYVTSLNGIQLNCFGTLTLGSLADFVVFKDTDTELVFLDGLFDAGWSGVVANIENVASVIELSVPMQSLGTDTVVNTRADLTVIGTAGTCLITSLIRNFRNVILTSGATVNGGAILGCQDLTQASAVVTLCTVKTGTAANVAVLDDPNFPTLTAMTFLQNRLGHAISLTVGNHTLSGITFTGYGGTTGSNLVVSSGAADAAVLNDTGTAIILTVSGGTIPSIRNGAGSTTTVIAALDYQMTGLDQGADVTIVNITVPATPVELFNEVAGVDGIVTYSFDGALTGTAIGVYIRNTLVENNEFDDVLPASNVSFKPSQDSDSVYI